jgi:hypothetical protein
MHPENTEDLSDDILTKIHQLVNEVYSIKTANNSKDEETDPQPLTEAEKVNINILQELANELNINAKVYIDQDKTTKVKVESHNKTSIIIFTGQNYNFEEESLKADKEGYTFKQAILMADIANKAKDLDYKLSYTSAYKDFYIPGKPYSTSSKFITQEKWASLQKENIPYHWIINLLRRLGKYET